MRPKGWQLQIKDRMAHSVDHYEPSHQDLHYLQKYLSSAERINIMVRLDTIDNLVFLSILTFTLCELAELHVHVGPTHPLTLRKYAYSNI